MAQPPRVCVDRVVSRRYAPERSDARRALRGLGAPVARMAMPRLSLWENGRELRVRFLEGSKKQRRRVEEKAHVWEDHANIKLRFVPSGEAEIRIAFKRDDGSWSAVGNEALIATYFPAHQPTMNFGWLEDDSDDAEYSRVVLHEFGHALGCIHEHSSPAAGLQWNKPKVYAYYSGSPNYWTKADIDGNIFERYSKAQTNFSEFDPDSIMLYEFPPEFFVKGGGTHANKALSKTDKQFIARTYPKPGKRAPRG
jgi:hypothetical protein